MFNRALATLLVVQFTLHGVAWAQSGYVSPGYTVYRAPDAGGLEVPSDASPSADAGPSGPFDDTLYNDCPVVPEGTALAQPLDAGSLGSGWFLPSPRPERLACIAATCQEWRTLSIKRDATPPSWVAWTVGLIAAGVVGFGAGYGVRALKPPTQPQP